MRLRHVPSMRIHDLDVLKYDWKLEAAMNRPVLASVAVDNVVAVDDVETKQEPHPEHGDIEVACCWETESPSSVSYHIA